MPRAYTCSPHAEGVPAGNGLRKYTSPRLCLKLNQHAVDHFTGFRRIFTRCSVHIEMPYNTIDIARPARRSTARCL